MILQLGGTGKDVGVAVMLFSLSAMLSTVWWGTLSDKKEVRKPFIILGFFGLLLCFLFLTIAPSYRFVIFVYTMCGALMSAEPPVTPVYLLRLTKKEGWDEVIGKFNAFCGWSWVFGLAIGWIFVMYYDLHDMSIFMAVLVSVSIIFSYSMLNDVPVYIMRPHIKVFLSQVVEKRRVLPNFLLHFPKPIRFEKTNNRNFFVAMLLMFVGSAFMNIPIVPFLKDNNISNSYIFLITLVFSICSALLYNSLGKKTKLNGCLKMLQKGIIFRILPIFLMLAGSMGIFSSNGVLVVSVAYSLTGLSWPFLYIPAVSFVSKASTQRSSGTLMGMYNFVSMFGLMIGGILSGYLYEIISFDATLLCAVVFFSLGYLVLRFLVYEPALSE